MKLLLNDAEKVRSLTDLPLSVSILLLQHCKWLSEVAVEAYCEDFTKLLQNLKLTTDIALHEPTLVTNAERIECLICVSDAEKGEAVGLLHCKHFFHIKCWKEIVWHNLNTNGNLWNFRCPMDGCAELVGAQCLREMFSTQEESPLCSRIEQHLLSNYVDTSPRLSWCPNEKGCEGIIYTPKALSSRESVECNVCGLRFCFHCKKMPHSPAFCDQVQQWTQKLDKGAHTAGFVLTHTKGCPNCNVRIEKSHGCNHMTCKCGHEFCWMCMGRWSDHKQDFFSCSNAKQPEEVTKNKKNDEIYFYKFYEKYMMQKDSSATESDELDMLAKRTSDFMETQENPYAFFNSPDFLANLLGSVKSALSIARERIAFAIVRSYYSDSRLNETQLFLHIMGSLQEATENLSHQLSKLRYSASINVKELQEGVSMVRRWISILEE
ncbi:unnamed protein product [Phytomonas sp. EM1]|nr:unnamed protein product [Phytomonas sp. EM1]|eukprot:CCW62669.1 unnamed protein product [Phytomonas sp. isolate EM1]